MSYRLLLHKTVTKFIQKCQEKQQQEIGKKFELLKENPYDHPQLDIPKRYDS
ncbi:hypothetical protein [Thioflexithrix psekupsensis]|uniref:hypothetical protein n=1 Tax=Thioflexithrix psekupsensis TaxID=1570016 RepID=UPI001593F157|nr:hypothetical protein [Thioflexithrix psekupsensis]